MSKSSEAKSKKQQSYDEIITHSSATAAAIGRRVPYHLEYIRKHREVKPNEQSRDNRNQEDV